MLPLPQGHLTLNPALLGECAMNCQAYTKALHYMQRTGVPQDYGVTHRVRGAVCCVVGRGGVVCLVAQYVCTCGLILVVE